MAITEKINAINKEFQATDDLIGSVKNSFNIRTHLYPDNELQKPQLIDVDNLIPKINKNNFDSGFWLNDINSTEKRIKNGSMSWQDYFNELTPDKKWIAKYAQSTQGQIRTTEDLIKANQQARDSALAQNEAIKAQTISAKAGKIALQSLATAGNMLAMWAFTKVIELSVTAVDNYIHRVDKAKEKLEDSAGAFESATSELKDLQEQFDETSAKMAELEADGITIVNSDEYDRLKAANEELERTIALRKIDQELLAKQATADAVDLYDKMTENGPPSKASVEDLTQARASDNLLDIYYTAGNLKAEKNDINALLATYRVLEGAIADTEAKMDGFLNAGDGESEYELENLENHVKTLEAYLGEAAGYISDYMQNAQQVYDATKNAMDLGIPLSAGQDDAYKGAAAALALIGDELLTPFQRLDDFIATNKLDGFLTGLFRSGKSLDEVTKAIITKSPALMGFLKENGISVEALAEKYKKLAKEQAAAGKENILPPTITSSIGQIARQLEPQFAKLAEAYRSIFSTGGNGETVFLPDAVDTSMLEGLRQSFAEIGEEIGVTFQPPLLNPFFDTLTDKTSTVEQVQDAFRELATAYFYSTDTLAQLDGETAGAIERQLEQLGVANANEIVAAALAEKELELAAAKEYLAQTSGELADATGPETAQFGAQQVAAGQCSEALALFYLKKYC